MTKIIVLITLLFLIVGCDGSGVSSIEDLVVSEESPKKVYFTLSILTTESYYLVLNKLDSIELEIDGMVWGYFKSEELDTTTLDSKFISNNYLVNEKKIEYLAIDQYHQEDTTTVTTAGHVVEELENRIILSPGDHVARIKQLQIESRDEELVSLNSIDFVHFHVNDADESVYVGDFQIESKL